MLTLAAAGWVSAVRVSTGGSSVLGAEIGGCQDKVANPALKHVETHGAGLLSSGHAREHARSPGTKL